ncbi:MAG TPA: hypothetical protein ENF87_00205 [Thermoproteales archaeon]|nr:hypothetical protein [Thermoproteales archaeon]
MSYSEILKVFEAELESDKLQVIDFTFYTKSREYLSKLLKKASEASSDVEKSLYLKEAKLVSTLLEKIFLLRMSKMLDMLFRGEVEKAEKNLAKEEVEFMKYLSNFLERLRTVESSKTVKPPGKLMGLLVRFKKPYSRLILENGSVMGPFHTGDIAYLPRKNAVELSKNDIVDIIA